MELTVDENHLGRFEALWKESRHQSTLVALELTTRRLIIVAPHPDDEVLGPAASYRQHFHVTSRFW